MRWKHPRPEAFRAGARYATVAGVGEAVGDGLGEHWLASFAVLAPDA